MVNFTSTTITKSLVVIFVEWSFKIFVKGRGVGDLDWVLESLSILSLRYQVKTECFFLWQKEQDFLN